MNTFREAMRKAAHDSLLKTHPQIIENLKALLNQGETPQAIEKRMVQRYGSSLIANAVILAAHYLKDHPELLKEGTE